MTRGRWLTSTNLELLTNHLFRESKVSQRKLRLFVVASGRRVEHLLTQDASRKALDAAERFAEGLIKEGTLKRYRRAAWDFCHLPAHSGDLATYTAAMSAHEAATSPGFSIFLRTPLLVARALAYDAGHEHGSTEWETARQERVMEMIALLRDIVGNPFQPLPERDVAWLEASGGLAARLANSIYEERHFTELPILADALEDAGCMEQRLLDHLRGPGPHDRGCWALDVILGKE
jgi:hypothetical protein